ncbi:MAG: AMP-binding protein [Nevskiales bacterium]
MVKVTEENLPLQRIYHWEKARADQVYLTQPMGGDSVHDYTWAQAVGEARRMAAYLKSHGFEPGARVAIFSKNCAHWIMADFAIWMAGYVSVPLYPTLAAQTIRQILEHSETKALFVGRLDDWEQMKSGIPDSVQRIGFPGSADAGSRAWDDIVATTESLKESPTRPAEDLATIIYTSGTTGMPKGVMHGFHSFAATGEVIREMLGTDENARMLSYLPRSHVAERVGVEANSIRSGFRVYFSESLATFLKDLQRARPTLFFSVPRLWVKFQQGVFAKTPKEALDPLLKGPNGAALKKQILSQLGLDTIQYAVTGAAPLPAAVLSWYRELGLELLEAYAMTENFGVGHLNRPGRARVGYVGEPQPGVECRLSASGEVLVKTPWNMQGYYKEPEKTKEVLGADGWLQTGDLGEIDEQGRLKITGRAKELFKTSKGKYVAPAPIENKLAAHSKIEACCVTGANYGQPFALVLLAPDVAANAKDAAVKDELTKSLAAHLQQVNDTLDPHEQLDFLCLVKDPWTVDNGFLTPTLKIKRNAVEKTYTPLFDGWLARREAVVWE